MRRSSPNSDDAWIEFHRRHGPRLLGFIRTQAVDLGEDTCDDLFAELVLRIDRGLDRYVHRHEGAFHSWCVKIAHNLCRDIRKVRADHPQPEELISLDEFEQLLGGRANPDQDAPQERSLSENEQRIRSAFDSLGAVDQAVLHFRFVNPLADAEIARIVQKPVDHIRKIRCKAITKLKRAYDQLGASKRRR